MRVVITMPDTVLARVTLSGHNMDCYDYMQFIDGAALTSNVPCAQQGF
jgi:hypothetical protein